MRAASPRYSIRELYAGRVGRQPVSRPSHCGFRYALLLNPRLHVTQKQSPPYVTPKQSPPYVTPKQSPPYVTPKRSEGSKMSHCVRHDSRRPGLSESTAILRQPKRLRTAYSLPAFTAKIERGNGSPRLVFAWRSGVCVSTDRNCCRYGSLPSHRWLRSLHTPPLAIVR